MVPHLGASTEEAETNSATMAAKQITAYLEHGIIKVGYFGNEAISPPLQTPLLCNYLVTLTRTPSQPEFGQFPGLRPEQD